MITRIRFEVRGATEEEVRQELRECVTKLATNLDINSNEYQAMLDQPIQTSTHGFWSYGVLKHQDVGNGS